VADNPQQTVRELRELVIAYAKQEATEPLKGLGRSVGLGVAGAVLIGVGCAFLAIGVLRALQDTADWMVDGNWSWVPYAIVIVALLIVAGIVWAIRSRAARRPTRSKSS
jgi:uncharacterized oligopeptide transporter (OPT) family protein